MADSHNYSIQRNYKYESHDKDENFNGLTEDEWKNRIREEWMCDRLKANYVVFIFHDTEIYKRVSRRVKKRRFTKYCFIADQ